jgi:nitroreductase
MNLNTELIDKVIEGRRSVYQQQYSGERVDDAIVKKILSNANWAPTPKLTEPWRFVVFTGEGLKNSPHFRLNFIGK